MGRAVRQALIPGAVAAGTAISIPSTWPGIGMILDASVWRNTHAHTSVVVHDSAVAADVTAFVPMYDGTGTALTVGANVGGTGGGSDVPVSSSNVAAVSVVTVTPTKVSSTSFSLNAATLATDIVVLDYIPVGLASLLV